MHSGGVRTVIHLFCFANCNVRNALHTVHLVMDNLNSILGPGVSPKIDSGDQGWPCACFCQCAIISIRGTSSWLELHQRVKNIILSCIACKQTVSHRCVKPCGTSNHRIEWKNSCNAYAQKASLLNGLKCVSWGSCSTFPFSPSAPETIIIIIIAITIHWWSLSSSLPSSLSPPLSRLPSLTLSDDGHH